MDQIHWRKRHGYGAGALVFAVIELDARQVFRELGDLVQQGNYIEALHAAEGLRDIWDQLDASQREAIRVGLERCSELSETEEWRAEVTDEILTKGGYTPEERAWREGEG